LLVYFHPFYFNFFNIIRDDLIYIDDNGLVKYKFTQSEIKEMVDDECDDLFEEYKSDEEFEDSNVMDTPFSVCVPTRLI
jgi:hypothetical protein